MRSITELRYKNECYEGVLYMGNLIFVYDIGIYRLDLCVFDGIKLTEFIFKCLYAYFLFHVHTTANIAKDSILLTFCF